MAKYAPPREDGLKPWLVVISSFGSKMERIIYAETRAQAEYDAKGRMRHTYAHGRRATPEDVATHA
jgi:hypothetical protein